MGKGTEVPFIVAYLDYAFGFLVAVFLAAGFLAAALGAAAFLAGAFLAAGFLAGLASTTGAASTTVASTTGAVSTVVVGFACSVFLEFAFQISTNTMTTMSPTIISIFLSLQVYVWNTVYLVPIFYYEIF
jgi:hypothetical protein